MTGTTCPLCGVDLDLPAKAELPKTTLERLARHFADDCKATARLAEAGPA